MANTQRYWDGTGWTDSVAPGTFAAGAPQVARIAEDRTSEALVSAGFVTALFIPLIGFVIGCVLLSRRPTTGVAIMGLSIAAAFFWWQSLLA